MERMKRLQEEREDEEASQEEMTTRFEKEKKESLFVVSGDTFHSFPHSGAFLFHCLCLLVVLRTLTDHLPYFPYGYVQTVLLPHSFNLVLLYLTLMPLLPLLCWCVFEYISDSVERYFSFVVHILSWIQFFFRADQLLIRLDRNI